MFAALKCNAYGFGLVPVACTVISAGANALSMVDPANAVALRRAGVHAPILVYPGALATPQSVADAQTYDFVPTLVDLESASIIRAMRLPAACGRQDRRRAGAARIPGGSGGRSDRDHCAHAQSDSAYRQRASERPIAAFSGLSEWQLGRFNDMCRSLAAKGIEVPMRMLASSKILTITRRATLNAGGRTRPDVFRAVANGGGRAVALPASGLPSVVEPTDPRA